jgi:hypothetical protein
MPWRWPAAIPYRADRSSVTISRDHCVRTATAASTVLPGEVVRVPARFF